MTPAEIREAYPQLTDEDIQAALASGSEDGTVRLWGMVGNGSAEGTEGR